MPERDVAGIRFGYGFAPHLPRRDRAEILAEISAPDTVLAQYPSLSLEQSMQLARDVQAANRDRRQGLDGASERLGAARSALRSAARSQVQIALARVLDTGAPLRERLMWFWNDHFTAASQNRWVRAAGLDFADQAIRPHCAGRFADMLKAVVRHPRMLMYLDQSASVGPDSPLGGNGRRGMNENLARELLELHTIGPGSGYTQNDVHETAELLTGLFANSEDGFRFRPNAAQPGAETILGRSYGSDDAARLADIDAFLEDLALRPETARHIARKLAVHFLADQPPEDLVTALETTYRDSHGDLGLVTAALLRHPSTANGPLQKVKQPFEFVASSLLTLGGTGEDMMLVTQRDLRDVILEPLNLMGQPFLNPRGPDGWPEVASAWITPQALASRISWATNLSRRRYVARVRDPRDLLQRILGPLASERLVFAVSAAETRAEGVALLLCSAEFNRR
jgi:uncharacterized protein (DUF1800 family)